MKKVSIIIPAYNVEKWIAECLESIVEQTYPNIEIILINDGSKDQTGKICEEFSQKDDRIIYIKKENGGLSAARNTGLDYATGEVICFVDSDDYLDKKVIERGMKVFSEGSTDLYMWNVSKVQGERIIPEEEIYAKHLSIKEFQCAVISGYRADFNLGSLVRTAWGKLYNADIIRKYQIRFREDMYIGEDAVFLMHYSQHISKITVDNYYGYFYRCVQTSLTQRYKKDLLEQSRIQLEAMKNFVQLDPVLEDAVAIYAIHVIHSLVENERKKPNGRTSADVLQWEKEYTVLLRRKVQLPIIGKMARLEHWMLQWLPISLVRYVISLYCLVKNKRW